MTIVDRIKAKIGSTNKATPMPEPDMNGNTITTVEGNVQTGSKIPKVQMPFSTGEYIPLKGLMLVVSVVDNDEETVTLKVKGLTHARARKLGLR